MPVARTLPPLWHTARTGEDRALAHRRFWLAWFAVLPFALLFYWVAALQIVFTAMALPAAAVLLLVERAASRPRRATRARAPHRER